MPSGPEWAIWGLQGLLSLSRRLGAEKVSCVQPTYRLPLELVSSTSGIHTAEAQLVRMSFNVDVQ